MICLASLKETCSNKLSYSLVKCNVNKYVGQAYRSTLVLQRLKRQRWESAWPCFRKETNTFKYKYEHGRWNVLVGKGSCHQVRWPRFDPRGGRRELTLTSLHCGVCTCVNTCKEFWIWIWGKNKDSLSNVQDFNSSHGWWRSPALGKLR